MALTNAERQAQHRDRIKAKLRRADEVLRNNDGHVLRNGDADQEADLTLPVITLRSRSGSRDIVCNRVVRWLEEQIVAGNLDAATVDMIGSNASALALRYFRDDGGTRKTPLTNEQVAAARLRRIERRRGS